MVALLIWGCRIFHIGADADVITKTILFTTGKEYEYGTSDDFNLTFFVGSLDTNEFGKMATIDFDLILNLYSRERGHYSQKISTALQVQVYQEDPLGNYVAIFANAATVSSFRKALSKFTSENYGFDNPLHEVKFLLKEKETELRTKFSGLLQVSVEGARDSYVSDATFKGNTLQDSAEYQKYVLDEALSGSVKFFGLNVNDRTIIVSSDGTMYTRQGVRVSDYLTVKAILMSLIDCQAISIR